MTTENERERILVLAGEPVAEVTPRPNSYLKWRDGVYISEGERLYTADQVLAARKSLEEEVEKLKEQHQMASKLAMSYENAGKELRQQLAEKNAEIERLNKNLLWSMQCTAESEAREQQYREALEKSEQRYFAFLKEKDAEADGFKAEGDMYGWNYHTGERAGANWYHLFLTEALKLAKAKPADTSALEAMIAKAGEVMRERIYLIGGAIGDADVNDAIRALPGVTLEDLH